MTTGTPTATPAGVFNIHSQLYSSSVARPAWVSGFVGSQYWLHLVASTYVF